jgi:asparagine N-glycosylation enzyme membrane subunit Stt3
MLLGVILVALGVLGALASMALRADERLVHPAAVSAALAGLLVLGALLLSY